MSTEFDSMKARKDRIVARAQVDAEIYKAARSDLARKVLTAVTKYQEPFALIHGVEGDIIDVTCEQIIKRLSDLFTREQIELEP